MWVYAAVLWGHHRLLRQKRAAHTSARAKRRSSVGQRPRPSRATQLNSCLLYTSTGSGDPTVPFEKTLHGKLPSRKITTGAAAGYSSYGNQIGLATGYVKEIYHPNYVAKRMEIGAVKMCIRDRPVPAPISSTRSPGFMYFPI